MNMKHDNCERDMGILLISLLAEEGVSALTMVLTLILNCLTTSWGGRFFYLTRPLLLREVIRKIPYQSLFLRFPCKYQNKCVSLPQIF